MPVSILPTHEEPIRNYTIATFYESLTGQPLSTIDVHHPPWGSSDVNNAAVKSVELRKYRSWAEWRHEYVVVTITYGGQDYVMDMNRAWAAPEGWRQYIPPIAWGSHKPSQNDIELYFPGDNDNHLEDQVERLVRVNFKSHRPKVQLSKMLKILAVMLRACPEYSLFGVNCWAWSRTFCRLLLLAHMSAFESGLVLGNLADVDEVHSFLLHSGHWLNHPEATMFNMLLRPTVPPVSPFWSVMKGIFIHGMKVTTGSKSSLSEHEGDFTTFHRVRNVWVFPKYTLDKDNQTFVTNTGIPHSFGTLGFARDVKSSPYSNSLCGDAAFLYLLTPPIHPPPDHHLVSASFSILGSVDHGRYLPRENPALDKQWVLLSCALVRPDESGTVLQLASRPTDIPFRAGPFQGDTSHYYYKVMGDRQLVDSFRDGDMIGVWASGSPTGGWSLRVSSAVVTLTKKPCFEGRSRAAFGVNRSQSPAAPGQQIPLITTSISRLMSFCFPSCERLEYGRIKFIALNGKETLGAGGADHTKTGIPHTFNSCGISVDHDTPLHITTLCGPGDFLYLLTAPVNLALDAQALSVTIYTWAGLARVTGAEPDSGTAWEHLGRFETAIVRQRSSSIEDGLQIIGRRHQVHKTTEWFVGAPGRTRTRMSMNHALVRELQNGDMIGLWARAPSPSCFHGVQKALIVVETDQQRGILVRSSRLAYDWIIEQFFHAESAIWLCYTWLQLRSLNALELLSGIWQGLWTKSFRVVRLGQKFIAQLCPCVSLEQNPPWSRLEFRRNKSVGVSQVLALDDDHHDCTITGLPRTNCDRSIDLDEPNHSNSLCDPGVFLYLITPQITLTRAHRPLRISFSTWSHDQGHTITPQCRGTYTNSQTWFEAAVVRPSATDGRLRVVGQRHELFRNIHGKKDRYYHHTLQLQDSHMLVQTLTDGDMIGLWARARYPAWVNFVQEAEIVVESDINHRPGLKDTLLRGIRQPQTWLCGAAVGLLLYRTK